MHCIVRFAVDAKKVISTLLQYTTTCFTHALHRPLRGRCNKGYLDSAPIYDELLSTYDELLSMYDELLSMYDELLSMYDELLSMYDELLWSVLDFSAPRRGPAV
jgi:hypothetical protein